MSEQVSGTGAPRRERPRDAFETIRGTARIGRRTKDLIPHLRPGDVVIIDHLDLDRVAAEGLVEARPAAVINVAACISGRYPNVGPLLLAAAGIPVLDEVGAEVMARVAEGSLVELDGDVLRVGDWTVEGTRQTLDTFEAAVSQAKATMGAALEEFAENTLEYLRKERHLVLDEPVVPEVAIEMRDRHVLVAVRGADYREDLASLRHAGYLREQRPVLIAVDGAADALLALGQRPDVIIGDMDSVSASALRSGATLVVHAYPGGKAPGSDRLDEMGLAHIVYEAPGTSEDIAMLLAYEKGASLIVAVGSHSSMAEFMDKGRAGMASTFLVRMKVGSILVDAKGVSRLYQGRVRKGDLAMLVAAAVFALLVVTAVSQPARLFLDNLWTILRLR